ncbi:MAG TPA: 2Fe-2S iron-sulfur cluster-binding protein, partial [Fimbriimonas sp.]|nr:2Fe-2S iron-sulfur cluster-binding protein [Fimbriimonas sp.]
MAAVSEVQTVNIIVNGIDLAVPKGELVVEAVKRVGFEIPIFCYHPRMKPVGMCRMCLVETGMKQPDGTIRMMPKPAAACTLPVSEGLVIVTESEAIKRDRKGVLEFLLVNHPLDCPICDRGGECPLQNNTLFYGPSTSRFVEMKRHAVKAFPLSEYVTLDLERCIQCARCVRFTEEISGDAQLAFRFRGSNTQPITFDETRFTSKFSGNVIEICPVGALTNRKSRFRARPWDLQTSPAICTNCSAGCAVWFDHRVGKFARLNGRTNEAINEEWTCDKGKFGHDHYNDDKRMLTPFVRVNDQLEKTDWSTAT